MSGEEPEEGKKPQLDFYLSLLRAPRQSESVKEARFSIHVKDALESSRRPNDQKPLILHNRQQQSRPVFVRDSTFFSPSTLARI